VNNLQQFLYTLTKVESNTFNNKNGIWLPEVNTLIHYNTLGKDTGINHQKEVLTYRSKNIHCIQLWDYQWENQRPIIISRFNSLFGLTKRIHGRKCEIKRIEQIILQEFLEKNHLLGTAKSKIKYGLFYQNELVGVASFSNKRTYQTQGKSAELIRYCTLLNTSITGGLSKSIKRYIDELSPLHIMSYADLDWSTGKAYETIGFEVTAITPAHKINIGDQTHYSSGNQKFEKII